MDEKATKRNPYPLKIEGQGSWIGGAYFLCYNSLVKYHIFIGQRKSSLRKWWTALNVILQNCTNSRTFSRDVYGDWIFQTFSENGNIKWFEVENIRGKPMFLVLRHADKTFHREAFWIIWNKVKANCDKHRTFQGVSCCCSHMQGKRGCHSSRLLSEVPQ